MAPQQNTTKKNTMKTHKKATLCGPQQGTSGFRGCRSLQMVCGKRTSLPRKTCIGIISLLEDTTPAASHSLWFPAAFGILSRPRYAGSGRTLCNPRHYEPFSGTSQSWSELCCLQMVPPWRKICTGLGNLQLGRSTSWISEKGAENSLQLHSHIAAHQNGGAGRHKGFERLLGDVLTTKLFKNDSEKKAQKSHHNTLFKHENAPLKNFSRHQLHTINTPLPKIRQGFK